MNIGLGNLTELKAQLLALSLQARADWDPIITAIGKGAAAQMGNYCNRTFTRAVGIIDTFSADRRHWWLRAAPVEAITALAKKDSEADGFVAYTLPPDGSSLIQTMELATGYIMFIAVQGYYWSQIQVTYTGGFWFDTTENGTGVMPPTATALPDDLKQAWYLQCAEIWNRRDVLGAGLAQAPEKKNALGSLELLEAVKQLINPYRRMQST